MQTSQNHKKLSCTGKIIITSSFSIFTNPLNQIQIRYHIPIAKLSNDIEKSNNNNRNKQMLFFSNVLLRKRYH